MARHIVQGEYTVVQTYNNHVHIYKGKELVCHMNCDKKMTETELAELIDFYENIEKGVIK